MSVIYNYQQLGSSKMSFCGGTDGQTTVHPHNGILFINKQEGIIEHTAVSSMTFKCLMLNERSQTQKLAVLAYACNLSTWDWKSEKFRASLDSVWSWKSVSGLCKSLSQKTNEQPKNKMFEER